MNFFRFLISACLMHSISINTMEIIDTASHVIENHPNIIPLVGFGLAGYTVLNGYTEDILKSYEQKQQEQTIELSKNYSSLGKIKIVPQQVTNLLIDETHNMLLSAEQTTLRLYNLKNLSKKRLAGIRYDDDSVIRSIDLDKKTMKFAAAYAKENHKGFILIGKIDTDKPTLSKEIELNGHTDWVTDVKFSPDGTLLASVSRDKTIKLWNSTTWNLAGNILLGHQGLSISFNSDGSMLASAESDGTIKIWCTNTANLLHIIEMNSLRTIKEITLNPSDYKGMLHENFTQENKVNVLFHLKIKNLLFVSKGHVVVEINLETNEQTLIKSPNLIMNISISPDGNYLLMRDDKASLYVLNLETNNLSAIPSPTQHPIQSSCSVIMNPNTKEIVSGYQESMLDYSLMSKYPLMSKLLKCILPEKNFNNLFTKTIGTIGVFENPEGCSFITH